MGKHNKAGMKVGSGHLWRYPNGVWSEKKVAKKKWRFAFKSTKVRAGKKAPIGSGMPVGSRLVWGIKAKQVAVKVSPNHYITYMVGTKVQKAHSTKPTGKLKFTKKRTPKRVARRR